MKFLDLHELAPINRVLTFDTPECHVLGRVEAYSCKAVNKEKKLYKQLETRYAEDVQFYQSISPDEAHASLSSPFGQLDQPSSRRTLFYLIATLNAAFPDHQFDDVKPEQFRKESRDMAINSLSTTLLNLGRNHPMAGDQFRIGAVSSPKSPPLEAKKTERRRSSSVGQNSARHQPYTSPSLAAKEKPTSPLLSATTPATSSISQLWNVIDSIIDLSDCDVYTYNPPDTESDPHGDGDDGDDGADGDDYVDRDDFDDDDDDNEDTIHSFDDNRFQPARPRSSVPVPTRSRNGGLIWSSNYFFYNKKMKRIVFYTLWAVSKGGIGPTSRQDDGNVMMMDNYDVPTSTLDRHAMEGWHNEVVVGRMDM